MFGDIRIPDGVGAILSGGARRPGTTRVEVGRVASQGLPGGKAESEINDHPAVAIGESTDSVVVIIASIDDCALWDIGAVAIMAAVGVGYGGGSAWKSSGGTDIRGHFLHSVDSPEGFLSWGYTAQLETEVLIVVVLRDDVGRVVAQEVAVASFIGC